MSCIRTTYQEDFTNPMLLSNLAMFPNLAASANDTSSDYALAQALQDDELRQREEASSQAVTPDLPSNAQPGVMDEVLAGQLQAEDELGQMTSLVFPNVTLELSSRDDHLSRTLSRVQSVTLTPRINSRQLPAPTYINQDRERLLLRLDMYDLVEKQMQGDGNCQFRALADQVYGRPEYHAVVRSLVVQQLRHNPAKYSGYVPTDYQQYCKDMAKSGTWGDHVTLAAAADTYGMRITVVTSFKDDCIIIIEPEEQRSSRQLYLSFWAEVHYNSIYPKAEPPAPESQQQDKVLGSKTLGKLVHKALGR